LVWKKLEEEQAIYSSQSDKPALDRDFERLLQICYRIGFREEKLKKNPPRIRTDSVSTGL